MSRVVRPATATVIAAIAVGMAAMACDSSPSSTSAAASRTVTARATLPVNRTGAIDLAALAATSTSQAAAPTSRRPSGPDLHDVVRRAHYAFRPSDASAAPSFAARGDGYRVTVDSKGVVALSADAAPGSARAAFVFTAQALATATGATRRETDGAITTERGEMTERLENRPEGLEASWSFARRPSARDLHLSISTSGLSYRSTDASGDHFRVDGSNDNHAAGVRVGRATWIDALGRRTGVSTHRDAPSSTLVFDVPAAVLDHSAYPATLDPLVGPENGGDTPVTLSSTKPQENVAVCASSSLYYVTWIDQRRLPEDPYDESSYDLYGARVDPATGRALAADADGVLLAPSLVSPAYPSCGSDGTNFLVAASNEFEMIGVRIDGGSGQPLASDFQNGLVLGAATGYTAPPSVAFANGNYAVVWSEVDRLAGARLPAVGAPLALSETIHSGILANPFIACSPTGCLISYLDTSDYETYLIHEDPATGPLAADVAAPIFFPYNNPFVQGMVWTGSGYLLPWVQIVSVSNLGIGVSSQLDAALWSADTNMTVGTAAELLSSGCPSNATLGFDGTRGVMGINIASPGVGYELYIVPSTLATTFYPALSGLVAGTKVGVAGVNGGSLFAATSPTAGSSIVTARIDDTTGAVNAADTGGVTLSLAANAEVTPAIAANANGALAVWTDDRVGADLTYAARLDKSGNVLPADIAGIPLTTISGQAYSPAVATDGTDFVVVWDQTNAGGSVISGGRVSAATGKLSQVLPPISDPNTSVVGPPAIAYGAGTYAIGFAAGTEVQANLVDATSLALTAGPLTFATPPSADFSSPLARNAKIAFAGSNFLFAWNQVSDVDGLEIAAARFDANGTRRDGDGTGVAIVPLINGASGIGVAGSASQSTYILTWFDGRDPVAGQQVYSRVVGANADFDSAPDQRVGGTGIVFAVDVDDAPATAVVDANDGLSFQVAWTTTSALYGALVGYDGTTRDAAPLLLADDPGYYAHPVLATVSPGSMLLAYSRDILAPPYGDYRVRARVLSTGPTAGACTSADDCASRNCADGFCCDAPCNGSCETCAATPGKCTPVENKTDPDSCTGNEVCDATGVCGLTPGNACNSDAACASGFCSDDVCCSTACSGACDVCNASAESAGTCTVVAAGSEGAPSCAPNVCNGTSATCPDSCTVDADCVRPYACDIHGVCALLTTGECENDVTLKSPDGNLTNCTPYRCESTACVTSCKSITDCAAGFVCGADDTCVAATADDLGSGCSFAGTGTGTGTGSGSRNDASDALFWILGACATVVIGRRRRVSK